MKPGDKYTIDIYLQRDCYAEDMRDVDEEANEVSEKLPQLSEDHEFQIKRAVKDLASAGITLFTEVRKSMIAIEAAFDTITDIK